jgi:hypothetical protein
MDTDPVKVPEVTGLPDSSVTRYSKGVAEPAAAESRTVSQSTRSSVTCAVGLGAAAAAFADGDGLGVPDPVTLGDAVEAVAGSEPWTRRAESTRPRAPTRTARIATCRAVGWAKRLTRALPGFLGDGLYHPTET